MKKSILYIVSISGLFLIVVIMWFFIDTGQELNSEGVLQGVSAADPIVPVKEAEASITTPQLATSKRYVTEFSDKIVDLETEWNLELGCYNLPEDNEMRCEYSELSASSYEEAVWMFENGYPTASVLMEMEGLSDEELISLSKGRHNWLPQLILGERYAEGGDLLRAELSFNKSEFKSPDNPFSMLRSGLSLIQHADPSAPGWSYRAAAVQFKKAALLGDYVGDQLLNELYNSYWNGKPAVFLTTDIIETATLTLSRYFELPQHRWPVQRRPRGG